MYSDTQLQKNVIEEISWDPSLRESEIGVAAKDGVITLTGSAQTFAQKYAAVNATRRVTGVAAIANDITVSLTPFHKRTDTEIAHAAMEAVNWNVLVPAGAIQLKVEDGLLTLSGAVEWDYQRKAAERTLRTLHGVRGVVDLVVVKAHAKSADVTSKIKDAFKRNAEIDADRITVTASDGTVTLKGRVRSWTERGDAERAAWSAPGVSRVQDELLIGV